MMNANSTFIWEGAIHIGNEPGLYGNAHYSGLFLELPLTIKNFDPVAPQDDLLKLEFLTRNVKVFTGYPGHLIEVRRYVPDAQFGNPFKWKETIIKNSDRILDGVTNTIVDIPITGSTDPVYLSIAIKIDTDLKPALYDDFLFTGLHYTTTSQNISVNLGFRVN